jgi:PAS domain-containing protein
VHKLFAKLLAKATSTVGIVDIATLGELVSMAFDEADKDRRRTDRSIGLMVDELEQLTRGLEKTVQQRTSELRQREKELRAQNDRFDAAVNHMSQGLAMFDPQGRVVICNQRYLDMYKLSPDQVRPGASMLDIVHSRIEAGTFAGDPVTGAKQLMDDITSGRLPSRTIELPDGRTISISGRKTPDGGWVATHEDITERPRSHRKAAHLMQHDAPLIAAE